MTTLKRALDSNVADRLAKAVAAIALVLSILLAFEQRHLTDCLTDYNEASASRTKAIADSTSADRAAQLAFADALAAADNGSANWEDVRAAARVWAAATRDGDAARAANPPPAPPSARC